MKRGDALDTLSTRRQIMLGCRIISSLLLDGRIEDTRKRLLERLAIFVRSQQN